jgi:Flp pilus assembly protein protease CpaA
MTQAPSPSQLIPNWIVAPLVFAAIPLAFDWKRTAAAQNA